MLGVVATTVDARRRDDNVEGSRIFGRSTLRKQHKKTTKRVSTSGRRHRHREDIVVVPPTVTKEGKKPTKTKP
jgi:hypothetical protein